MKRNFMLSVFALLSIQVFLLFGDDSGTSGIVADTKLHKPRADADVEQLGVIEAYSEAVKLEEEITRMYQEVRASRLSKIQRQSLEKSMEEVLVPISHRLEPKKDVIESSPKNSDELKAYQDELQKIMTENKAIVANSEEMLRSLLPEPQQIQIEEEKESFDELLAEIATVAQSDIKKELQQMLQQAPEQLKKQIEQLEQKIEEQIEKTKDELEDALKEMQQAEKLVEEKLEEIAKQDNEKEDKEKFPEELAEKLVQNLDEAREAIEEAIESISEKEDDVKEKIEVAREAMEKIEEAIEQTSEADKILAQQEQQEPKKHTETAMEKLNAAKTEMQAALEAAVLAAQLDQALDGQLSEDLQIATQQALGVLARAESGYYLDITNQMRGKDLNIPPEEAPEGKRPPNIKDFFKNQTASKVLKNGGNPAVWFYVSNWYILGPYDNKGRMNIQRVFPPESIIDLDANYLGKDNSRLSWFYDSFGQAMVNPTASDNQYTIYYGYTELYFEETADLWIAVGSDDRSDLWINGLPVWHSSNQLKAWRIDEGYRKVHFKKGLNKILFRLENGWYDMGFSLLINANPEIVR